jgi:hypothetical protein
MGFSFYEIGGYKQLYLKYMDTSYLNSSMPNYKCALPKENAFQMLRGISDNDMPWLGFLIGQTPSSGMILAFFLKFLSFLDGKKKIFPKLNHWRLLQ